ncbi:porin [Burkholderia pseudomallei]|nr:porin [Burkholderia pseudomallei]MBF3409383.1 porin [Burkholderia pseudomallei]MBF3439667.1 porin [Burkholderia pseudomallei]MBF3463711.1 porin [Burkholderia pseudomallei]MBF3575080.1 porin [Burkholderia pseudomallei]MBF3619108.1 porin [Burkholderia pseudomallei]
MTADVGIGRVRRIETIRRRLVTGSAKNGFVFFANGIRLCA